MISKLKQMMIFKNIKKFSLKQHLITKVSMEIYKKYHFELSILSSILKAHLKMSLKIYFC